MLFPLNLDSILSLYYKIIIQLSDYFLKDKSQILLQLFSLFKLGVEFYYLINYSDYDNDHRLKNYHLHLFINFDCSIS